MIFSASTNKIPDTEAVPLGLQKMKEGGLRNMIFEVDLSDSFYDFSKFTMDDMCALVKKWIVWTYDELHEKSKVFVNFRDFPDVMAEHPERCFQLVQFLAELPERIRPIGIIYEEPKGTFFSRGMWSVGKIHPKNYGYE